MAREFAYSGEASDELLYSVTYLLSVFTFFCLKLGIERRCVMFAGSEDSEVARVDQSLMAEFGDNISETQTKSSEPPPSSTVVDDGRAHTPIGHSAETLYLHSGQPCQPPPPVRTNSVLLLTNLPE